MRIFFDTEYIDDGRNIELISIGLVREDGGRLYCESSEVDWRRASDWVRQNVLPKLDRAREGGGSLACSRAQIARQIEDFVGPEPEFWAHYAAYDWVALCQLYGPMISIPFSWPRFCIDLQQEFHRRGIILALANRHNALDDALDVLHGWHYLRQCSAYANDWQHFGQRFSQVRVDES